MSLLIGVLSGLPHLLVDLVALALAVSRWSRHPAASMFLAVGTVLRLMPLMSNLVLARAFGSAESMGLLLGLSGLLSAAGAALTVAAVFADRARGDEPPRRVW